MPNHNVANDSNGVQSAECVAGDRWTPPAVSEAMLGFDPNVFTDSDVQTVIAFLQPLGQ
jgi:hypothetical protein